jgi:predicted nucleic acid-binding protein
MSRMLIHGYRIFADTQMPELSYTAFADTSFFIRLLKEDDPLHSNAKGYLEFLLDNSAIILCSTIVMAEYCVKGKLDELPLEFVQIIPFNPNHAVKAGEFARICFESRIPVTERVIIPNDCKLLAQAEIEHARYFLTSDTESKKLFDALSKRAGLTFDFVDIRVPASETFGVLVFPS